jgi:hypothetical protein
MCPVCGCGIGHFNDAEKPWIVQHMVISPTRGLTPADEILCNLCYSWYANYVDVWLHNPNTPTRKLTAIGGKY